VGLEERNEEGLERKSMESEQERKEADRVY